MKCGTPAFYSLLTSHLLYCSYVYWSVPHPAFLPSPLPQALAMLSQERGCYMIFSRYF